MILSRICSHRENAALAAQRWLILTDTLLLAFGLGIEAVVVAIAASVHEELARVGLAVVVPLGGCVLAIAWVLLQVARLVVRRMTCAKITNK